MFRMQQWMLGMTMAVLAFAPAAAAQEVVVTGPPPVLRARLDAFLKAFNSGDAAQFEKMAAEGFTAWYLKSQTADERRKAYLKMRADFGTLFENDDRKLRLYLLQPDRRGKARRTSANDHNVEFHRFAFRQFHRFRHVHPLRIAGPIRLLLYPLIGIPGASTAPVKKPSATPHPPTPVFAKQDAFVELL